jgi:hypothetical protein
MSRRETITESMRRLIAESDETEYAIAKATGISKSALSRFRTGGRGLTTQTLDILAEHFGWRLVAAERPKKKRRRT